MHVIVPFTGEPNAEVDGALIAAACLHHTKDWWDVSGSNRAYYDLLRGMWARGGTFAVVEHDVVVHEDTLDELAACPHDWCAHPFMYLGRATYGLGCVKFSAGLIARHPDALLRVGVMSDDRHGKRHWCRLDAWLTCVLEGSGERRHKHQTLVRHLNVGCAHGCITNP